MHLISLSHACMHAELVFVLRSSSRASSPLLMRACMQNFGARDPTAAEIESNFSDKVQGNWDTAHVIK